MKLGTLVLMLRIRRGLTCINMTFIVLFHVEKYWSKLSISLYYFNHHQVTTCNL